MADQYFVGNQVRTTCTFEVSTVKTDPTTITLKIKDPSGNTDTYTYALSQVTKSAAGVYYKDFDLDEAGYWKVRWEGTGTCKAATEAMLRANTEF